MSLGAMTVMSYDIWKAKCAAEKKRQEAEGRARPPSPLEAKPDVPMRKRAHTFIAPVRILLRKKGPRDSTVFQRPAGL